jgi:hypothetical protein
MQQNTIVFSQLMWRTIAATLHLWTKTLSELETFDCDKVDGNYSDKCIENP